MGVFDDLIPQAAPVPATPGAPGAAPAGGGMAAFPGMDGAPTNVTGNTDSVASSIARGDNPGPRNISSPASQSLMDRVMKINPNYNGGTYGARQKAQASLAAGPLGESIKALNTIMGHAGGLMDSMHNLNNGEIGPLNTVQNGIAGMFGESLGGAAGRLADVRTHLTGVSSEAGKVFAGKAPAMSEIKDWADNFPTNATPSAQAASFKALAGMLHTRMGAMQGQYDQTMMGSRAPVTELLTPSSRAMYQHIMSQYGGDPATQTRLPSSVLSMRRVK